MMDIDCFGHGYRISNSTVVGRRKDNEDSFALVIRSESRYRASSPLGERQGECAPGELMMLSVFDGMGGLSYGAEASRMVSEGLTQWALNVPIGDIDGLMLSLLNALIPLESELMNNYPDGGTTASVVIGTMEGWFSAHLGDSRCYIVDSKGGWRTSDHSKVEEMRIKGLIDEDMMNEHPLSNLVSRYVGGGHATSLEFDDIPEGWESIIICTDGAFGYMSPDDYWELMFSDFDANEIVKKAYDKGSTDNITVLRIDLVRR